MKKFLAILCALVLCLSCATAMTEGESHPKYVFMFIGDGMGNPQVTATQYYLGSIENPDSKFPVPADLSFTKFPYLGLVTTYDSSSFCPDSASTATSMASGKKTLSGVINYDETLTNPYKIITEYAKEAGKKVGVITSCAIAKWCLWAAALFCCAGRSRIPARWERLCSSRTSTPMQLDLNTCTGLKQWAGDNHDGQKRKGALLPAVQYR